MKCSFARACAPIAATWRVPCLADTLHAAEREADAPVLDQAAIERLYDHLYEQHFGQRSWRKSSTTNNAIFGRILALCVREDVDPEAYVTASMLAMKPWLADHTRNPRRLRFMPNMLSGERAKGRYNAFLRRTWRTHRTTNVRVADVGTDRGTLRTTLCESEQQVADYYINARIAGRPVKWADAALAAEPSEVWRLVHDPTARVSNAARALVKRIPETTRQTERKVASLRAAVLIAERTRTGLARQLAVDIFSWSAFADVLERLAARVPKPVARRVVREFGAHWSRGEVIHA